MICFYPLISYAQSENLITKKSRYPEDRRWMLSVGIGTNVDLSGSSSNPYSGLLESRTEVAYMQNFRLTHLFSEKVGWYVDMQYNIYWNRRSEYLNNMTSVTDIIETFFEAFANVFHFIYPSADAGLVYRIEHGRWKIHPEAGIGYGIYLMSKNNSKDKTDKDGAEYRITYKQRAESLYMNVGVSANYFVSDWCYFVLKAGFSQPLQKSYAELIQTKNDVQEDRVYYETSRIGRNLKASLGFGFLIGKKH